MTEDTADRHARYNRSEKGRARSERFDKTEVGRARKRAWRARRRALGLCQNCGSSAPTVIPSRCWDCASLQQDKRVLGAC